MGVNVIASKILAVIVGWFHKKIAFGEHQSINSNNENGKRNVKKKKHKTNDANDYSEEQQDKVEHPGMVDNENINMVVVLMVNIYWLFSLFGRCTMDIWVLKIVTQMWRRFLWRKDSDQHEYMMRWPRWTSFAHFFCVATCSTLVWWCLGDEKGVQNNISNFGKPT